MVPAAPIPWGKRGFDLLLTLVMLPLLVLILPVLYCWIKLMSPGPFIYRQTRIGRGGKPFTMYKVRTMKPLAETTIHEDHVRHLVKTNQPLTKLDHGDSRLIKGGCMIRMSGLDELPQLLNVLRGEMSLVGPRPCMSSEIPLYDEDHLGRFTVQPGLTGLWQVQRSKATTFRDMVAMDMEYAACLSLWTDFKIIMKTPLFLLVQSATCTLSIVRKFAVGRPERASARMSRESFTQPINPGQ